MNQYNSQFHHRCSIRLKGYDYSGAVECVTNNPVKWNDDNFYSP